MTQRVVDLFESVQINAQHCDVSPMPTRYHNGLAQSIFEERSVGQIRENIVLCQMGHLQSHCRSLGYAAENDNRPGQHPLTIMDRGGGILDGTFLPVAPNENTVWRESHGAIFHDR